VKSPEGATFYRLRPELRKPKSFAIVETCLHDLDSPNGMHNLREDAFPDFEPEFYPMHLSRRSSLVDIVQVGAGVIGGLGLLVSDRVLDILEAMKLPPYRPYRVALVHNDEPVAKRYFWVQVLALDNYAWIDFAKSSFRALGYGDFETEGEPVEIRDERELRRAIEENRRADRSVEAARLTLNPLYARSAFDLFHFPDLGFASNHPIINARLKAALEKEKVVGYELTLLRWSLDAG
jgi:hypothetical protein